MNYCQEFQQNGYPIFAAGHLRGGGGDLCRSPYVLALFLVSFQIVYCRVGLHLGLLNLVVVGHQCPLMYFVLA